jgi:hypothetical protein
MGSSRELHEEAIMLSEKFCVLRGKKTNHRGHRGTQRKNVSAW